MDLPRVRGACCLDGVDPELVSDVFQPLQGFFIGLVVASHAFLGFVSSDRTKKNSHVQCCATPLLAARSKYNKRRSDREEGHLCVRLTATPT